MRHLVIGTAGHIDHGKSALVRALTGIDPDRLKEEKARGITIELGFAHARFEDVDVALVDVPGHERFVKTMLAGASGIDAVLLVVAADESVMPQTREHFDICHLLGIRAGVVVLTKADLVDADTLDLVRLEVRDLVAGSFLDGAPAMAVSARTGNGLDELRTALCRLAIDVPPRPADGPVRLPIDRVFSMRGFGTVVTGTLVSGTVRVDDEFVVLPSARRVKVRGLQGHGTALAEARAGQRVAVNLTGADVADLTRGDVIAAPSAFVPTRRLDAAVELLPGERTLRHGARVRVHHGTSEVLGRIAVSSPRVGEAAHDAFDVAPGSRAHVRLRLESEAVLTRGDRFVLRAYSPSRTIAGGIVLDPHPPRGAIRTSPARARFDALDPGPGAPCDAPAATTAAVRAVLAERAGEGLPAAALTSRLGIAPPAIDAVVTRLVDEGVATLVGERLVAPGVLTDLEARLVEALAAHHRAEPLSEGLPREELRARVFARAHAEIFEAVVERLTRGGTIVARDRVALASHRVSVSPAEARALEGVRDALERAGLTPPDTTSLASSLGLPPGAVDQALRLLARQRAVVRLDTLWFATSALARLKDEVAELKAVPGARVDVASFKERYGVSRKFAIPLLEYLDRERVTRRVGDSRIVL